MANPRKKHTTQKSPLLLIVLAVAVIGIVLIVLLTADGDNWSKKERISINQQMHNYVLQECDEWDHMVTVTVTDQISRDTKKGQVTYDVSVYQVAEGIEVTDALWKLKSNAAARHEALNKIGVASITLDMETGNILNFQNEPAGQ